MMETLILAQARDGSTSIREFIIAFFHLNGEPLSMGYVSDTFELWPAMLKHIREGYSDDLYRIMEGWNQRVEVSHGLAFVLPTVRAIFGPDLRILRVVRDRADHIASLAKRVHIDPEHWIGYADEPKEGLPDGATKVPRPTAVDFDESSLEEWQARSIEERFGWYVDKQARLLDEHLPLFNNVTAIHTEQLSDAETVRKVGAFIDPNWKVAPRPVHIHKTSHVDVGRYSAETRKRIEVYWEQLDLDRVIEDPSYGAEFIVGDLLERHARNPEELRPILTGIRNKLTAALKRKKKPAKNNSENGK